MMSIVARYSSSSSITTRALSIRFSSSTSAFDSSLSGPSSASSPATTTRPALSTLGTYQSSPLQSSPFAGLVPTASSSAFSSSYSAVASSSAPLVITPSSSLPSSILLHTLSRLIMKSGQLPRAQSHLSTCLSTLALLTSSPPLPLLTRALAIVSPSIRLVGRRKGTKSLPTPQPLTEEQRTRQAWKWIVESSEKRKGVEKVFGKRLASEVMAVLGGQSDSIKKREARHAQGVTGRANVGR